MREGSVRTVEALVAIAASYMAAVTMVQTTLYNKILDKFTNYFGPALEPYLPYVNIGIIVTVLFISFTFWRKADEVWFGRLFNLNMLMFFPAVLDFSTFNWIGLIFDLTPIESVSNVWVFGVGLFLQVTYLMLRYTVRFRYTRAELEGRGSIGGACCSKALKRVYISAGASADEVLPVLAGKTMLNTDHRHTNAPESPADLRSPSARIDPSNPRC